MTKADLSFPTIGQLEMHVSHACNLTCESCSHFSNQNHKGHVDLETAASWMAGWSSRVNVEIFALVGGEPALNPKLAEFPPLVRRHWPKAEIWIITNGFFLKRHPELPKVFATVGNCKLFLSVHHASEDYTAQIQPTLDLLTAWERDYAMAVTIWPAQKRWTIRYTGFGGSIEPFKDQQPRLSWERCAARRSPQLFEGNLWKCPPIAYLPMQHRKYALSKSWAPYLSYQPLFAGCSDAALQEFLTREDEAICSMCTSNPTVFELANPIAKSRQRSSI